MNAPVAMIRKEPQNTIPALAMNEDELMSVLQNSVYPGAKPESIKLVINACRASGKDPLKKPYHIVPMQVSTGQKDDNGWDVKVWRDVVMPGINDYRTDAARTGQHAGTSDPEFGPDVTETLDGVQITYPQWCRVVVRRQLASGQVVEFAARELWKENYATKSSKSSAPNAMWKRRPYAQLAKCAEAQALRKGFPEVGSQPTADEMEGKEIDMGTIDRATGEVTPPPRPGLPPCPDTKLDRWIENVRTGKAVADELLPFVQGKHTLNAEQIERINTVVAEVKTAQSQGPIDGDFTRSYEENEQ